MKFPILFLIINTFFHSACNTNALTQSSIYSKTVKLAEQNNFSGSLLVAHKDSVIVNYAKGYLNSNRQEEITTETPIAIASITKLFVKHSIFLLEEQGKLSLNDKLSKFRADIQYSDSITISDLIYHSSGLPDIHNEIAIFNDPWNLNKPVNTEDLFAKIKSLGYIHFKPGTNSRYSNSNYLILANIIESISGMPLDIFLDKNIFIPYGMKSTGLYKEHSSILGHAQGSYRRNNETMWMPDFNFKNFWGSGNGYSTSNDLFKYMINVKKYLNPKYSKQLIQHSGYYLGYRTLLKSIPELGITIVILSNNGNFNPEIILNSTLNYIIDEISSRDLKKSDTSFTGKYSAERFHRKVEIVVTEKDNKLFVNNMLAVEVSQNVFLLPQNGYVALTFSKMPNNSMSLEMNDNGNIFIFERCKL